MAFRLRHKLVDTPSAFKYSGEKNTDVLKTDPHKTQPLNVELPADDSDQWVHSVDKDGNKIRTFTTPGSNEGGTGVNFETAWNNLPDEKKAEFGNIDEFIVQSKDWWAKQNPGREIVQKADTYEKIVSWRQLNNANYRGRSWEDIDGDGDEEYVYNKDLDYNWAKRYRTGVLATKGHYGPSYDGGFYAPQNYSEGTIDGADTIVGNWNFDWQRNHAGGSRMNDDEIGARMNGNRMKYLRMYEQNYIALQNEGLQPGDPNYLTKDQLNQDQHNQIFYQGNSEWFRKLKSAYPNVKWGSRGSKQLKGDSGYNPYQTVSDRQI